MTKAAWILALCVGFELAVAEMSIETVSDGLHYPWALEFLPDGSMLLTERSGSLRIIKNGVLVDQAIDGVPEVFFDGQGGLFDVVLDPDFERNRTLYLSYAHGNRNANATRVMRAVFDGQSLTEQYVVFTASPLKSTNAHFGGRMAILPDRTMLLTIGEGFELREQAQSADSLLGKIVRLTTTGDIPLDNPFVGQAGASPEIWSLGHRNPQAILRDPLTGNVYMHEHGPRGGDELNLISPGNNYGWPATTHGLDYTMSAVTPYSELPGIVPPLIHWTPSIAPSGMDIYYGELFPQWHGDLFVTALVEKSVRRISLQDGKVVNQEILFGELDERMRDVKVGPDGSLYLLTDGADARLFRVTP